MPHREQRFDKIYPATIVFSIGLILLGLLLDDPANIPMGFYKIITMQDLLITDYVYTAGPGAALINAALVTIISISIIRLTGDPYNGFTIVEMGLMAGFSLFGKNIVNIWPIIFGTWLYARYQREPFAKYASVALLATSLAPMVSYMALGSVHASLPLGALTGILIGFVLPSLSAYTYKVQNGMNLYNMGFACGLFAMMIVPILTAFGDKPDSALYWATGYNIRFAVAVGAICVLCILLGFFGAKLPPWAVWAGYRRLISTTGRAPSDYLRMFGSGPVLVNIGVNGLISIAYVLLIGGDLNGPTLGGVFTIMGFSAFGKHAMNIIPVMMGIALGGACSVHTPAYPALQLAGLFGTTLAPIAGHFGWPAGILAGFIHSGLVLQTGGPVAGLNLYNNGFSGGLIAIVLYPTITAIWKHRRPTLRDEDYYDLFEETAPIDTSFWRTDKKKGTHHSIHEMHPEHHSMWDTPDSLLQEDDAPEDSELHISTEHPAGELEHMMEHHD